MARARGRVRSGIGRVTLTEDNIDNWDGRFDVSYQENAIASAKQITDQILSIFAQLEGELSGDIMLMALEPTFQLSQSYCPVDTGKMLNSGYLKVAEGKGKNSTPRVEIGYGYRGIPDYTAFVHENMDQPHRAPTRAKWLQAAVMEDMDGIWSRVQDGYATALRGH